MKIRKLANAKIDKTAWDECISRAENRRVYALSWYLDSVTGKRWDGLVLDDYRAVMPLPYVKKAGIRFYMQPWFSQQLGPFWIHSYPTGLLDAMEKNISSPFYELNLNSNTRFFPEYKWLELKPNMVLPLNKKKETLYAALKTNHRRNLKKAKKIKPEIKHVGIETYMAFKTENSKILEGKKTGKLENILQKLHANNALILRGVWLKDELLAAVCWIKDFNRLVYFQAASSEKGKKYASAFLLVEEMIETYANTHTTLDFEGSQNQGIQRFYRGFGATNESYPVLLSKGMRLVKYIRK
ncbi:MAG TPA: GNAT family N-acetyltransferase [Bacteroidales bacterium]|nr:GNAT family N-acetyltransferase [Bacteroidales bacterium]